MKTKAEEIRKIELCPKCGSSSCIWWYNNDLFKCNKCKHDWAGKIKTELK